MKFRLVDKIVSWQRYRRIRGIKAVSFEEYCLKEPFGDEGRLPELLMLESVLQLGNWLILLSSDFVQMGLVVKLPTVHFLGPLPAGRQMRMEVNLLRQGEEGFVFLGEGHFEERVLIRGECLAVPVPARDYVNPDDLRVLFSEIYQPEPADDAVSHA
jgi:3-hydroxymyristoyl/3-hydroxydecanoyl-(acyl carrier protein) dehydratase